MEKCKSHVSELFWGKIMMNTEVECRKLPIQYAMINDVTLTFTTTEHHENLVNYMFL